VKKSRKLAALMIPFAIGVTAVVAGASGVFSGSSTVLLGNTNVEPWGYILKSGQTEAFKIKATKSGPIGSYHLWVGTSNTATSISVGLYSDSEGHAGSLISSANIFSPKRGEWNEVSANSSIKIESGNLYWLALLGHGGELRYRDAHQPCASETNLQTNLTSLPQTWGSGTVYPECVVSAYVTAGEESTVTIPTTPTAPVTTPTETIPTTPISSNCTKTIQSIGNLSNSIDEVGSNGGTVCLGSGNYGEINLANVDPQKNVSIQPTSGANVTVNGVGLQLDSNLTFRGLNLSSGVSATQGDSNLVFQGNIIKNTVCGFFFYGWEHYKVSNIQILENTMENLNFTGSESTCSGEGVVFIGNVNNFVIDNNTFGPKIANHYTQTGGIENLQENGNLFQGPSLRSSHGESDHQNVLQIFGSSKNVEFSNNILRNTGTNAGSLLFQEGQMKNVKVDNNLFDHDAEGYSVQIYPIEELEFVHNTVVDSHWGVYFRSAEPRDESHGDDYKVTNNIFVGNTGTTPDVSENGCSSNCEFDYNVSGDSSAGGSHSVKNWKPDWMEEIYYQPVGLTFSAGYVK
jgi:hypothetical protein